MDPMPPFTISPILREAAELRIEELNQVKESFKNRYQLDANRTSNSSIIQRVSELLEEIKRLDPYLENDDDLPIMTRYVAQAQNDKSVSPTKLLKFEEQLQDKLRRHLNRMEVSSLHVELMQEVMNADSSTSLATGLLEKVSLEDDFEVVENELDEVLEKFEKDTFTAKDVNVEAIEAYLSSLFVGGRNSHDLEDLREEMRLYGERLMDGEMDVDQDVLMWIIMDLLKNNLISLTKKKTLENYLQSPIALRELAATLNMKSFRHWRYRKAEKGLPVSARQNAEGQYCIAVDEEVIDMLFLHCTAICWSSKLKECLKDFVCHAKSFKPREISTEESQKRQYFLTSLRRPSKPKASACTVCHPYYPNAPMLPPGDIPAPYQYPPIMVEGPRKKSKKKSSYGMPLLPPPPPPGFNSLDGERCREYTQDFFMSRLPTHEGCTPKVSRPEDLQAKLIKTLGVEAKLRRFFDGQAHGLTLGFDSLAATLPHQTILTVLKFLGVPDAFLDFFKRFLQAKLNIGPATQDSPDRVLPRARGVPIGHGFELFFSEAILFFLDLVVHQKTQSYLYRLHDKCYFVGTKQQHFAVTEEAAKFAAFMGLNIKHLHSGPGGLNIGCLKMDLPSRPNYSTVTFKIDDDLVIAYADRVRRNLDACKTVLDWVRVWNSTVGTYARHLFGPLAEVFGKAHLEHVKMAYMRIFSVIFPNNDLTSHVKTLLQPHIKAGSIDQYVGLEALIYLPQAYGGLGVKNPFITLNLAHSLCEMPDAKVWEYFKEEEAYSMYASESYRSLTAEQRQDKLDVIFAGNKDRMNASLGEDRNLKNCMPFAEITAHREYTSYPNLPPLQYPARGLPAATPCLLDMYEELLREPVDHIDVRSQVCDDVSRLAGNGDMKSWRRLSGEDQWVLGMYGAEAFEQYGTLEIWWAEGVPKEVYKAIRGHVWSDGYDDDSTLSSMSEV